MSFNLKNVRKTLLADHNRARSGHGADSLKTNSELESTAQKWAEHLAAQNRLEHGTTSYKGNPIGENVFGAYHSAKTPDDIAMGATANWYSEIEKFDFTKPEEKLSGCGHFTQVVWKASKEVGFGIARSGDGHVYVVGQYYPAGNFIGHVAENVKPSKDGKRVEFTEPKSAAPAPAGSSGAGAGKVSNLGEPIKKETKTEVKEEVVNGRRVKKTITTETDNFADGSTRTTTRTQTETSS